MLLLLERLLAFTPSTVVLGAFVIAVGVASLIVVRSELRDEHRWYRELEETKRRAR